MLDPYENIFIGTFLYSMGIVIGRRSAGGSPPGVVNLLQQTPLDGVLSDVHLSYPGLVRLIEFKRTSNTSDKEELKRAELQILVANRTDLQDISRTVHWYIETSESPIDWSTRICPYLDFEDRSLGERSLIDFATSIADAVERLQSTGVQDAECDPEKVQLYLNMLATCSGKKGSSSGVLVIVGPDGVLRYIALDNIHDLRLELSAHKEQTRELSQRIEALRVMDSGRIDRERGISYGR